MLKFFNSLSRAKEEFVPLKDKVVNIYTCGPTVYDYSHIGNMRAYIFDDLLIRTLLFNGYKVNHVINLTDIGHLTSDADAGEDKMMKAIKREGLEPTVESMKKLADKYTAAFQDNLKQLNVFQVDNKKYKIRWVKASDHVGEMIKLVKELMRKGFVYETDLAIYFDVTKFENYTKLSGQKLDEKKVAARAEVQEDPDKLHPADFAVWFKKAGKHINDVMTWPSPWGEGFPGWHIECSAMAMKYLGETLDIHCGGIDHINVHHSNEIAQSEAATGKPFSRFWMHNEFIDLNNAKISKSAGTFITLKDLIDKKYNPLALRYLYLGTHYRQKLNFSFEALDGAQNALNNLYRDVKTLDEKSKKDKTLIEKFKTEINDDLNLPKALALVWEILKDKKSLASLIEFDKVLGLSLENKVTEKIEAPQEVLDLVEKREAARKNKDWAEADRLRDEVSDKGWMVEDAVGGYKLVEKNVK
jgi:cysteinyl-tRNA synthetase